MRRNLVFFALPILFILSGCISGRGISKPNYFSSESTVGLMIVTNPIDYNVSISSMGGGLIGTAISFAVSPMDKYDEALKVIKNQFKHSERIKEFYTEAFKSRGKKIIEIEENNILKFDARRKVYKIDGEKLDNYWSPKESKKKYFKAECVNRYCKKDLRYLKEKFQIDELIIVFVQYNIRLRYAYAIEMDRYTATVIDSEIIDLNDNSVIFKNDSRARIACFEEWDTPPEYKNMKDGMYTSIEEAILKLKEELLGTSKL